jgi:hypothetical protein
MEPELPQKLDPKKKRLLVIGIIAVILLGVIVAIFIFSAINKSKVGEKETAKSSPAVTGPEEFRMMTDATPVKYAGHPVYDACGLIPFDTVRKTINNYQTLLDMNGTDKKPKDSLTIEHKYIDRDITTALGKDGQPRPTGTTIGSEGLSANSFISGADSNCWYGQGESLSIGKGSTFAKLYVTQQPTPLSSDLVAYLGSLQKAASQEGIDAYVEPKADSGGFVTSIVAKPADNVAVFIKSSTKEFGQKATLAVMEALSEGPKGPMNLEYPLGWSKMPNPCKLLSADDFQRMTERPASALAEDTLGLNEIGGRLMSRSCERLEVERLDGSPIAKSYVIVRMGMTENDAKTYVNELKEGKIGQFKIQPLKQKIKLADDAYIKVITSGDKAVGYELDMRIGQAVIVLALDSDKGVDASPDAFAARMLPVARSVAERYRN